MARPARPKLFTLGLNAAEWIENYCVHGPGDVQGEPVVLDDEELDHLVNVYAFDDELNRIYDEVLYSRPKGRRKSELYGWISCFQAWGPCVPAGFDADDRPVGRQVRTPFIRCLATEEEQSGNTYDNISVNAEHFAEHFADEFGGIDLGNKAQSSTRIFLEGGGEIRPSTASDAAKDGGKETFSTFDETHLYTKPSLKGMYRTVKKNGRKRLLAQPWFGQTSTMYARGEDSICEQTHAAAAKTVPGLLVDHLEASDEVRLGNKASLRKELRRLYRHAPWVDVDGIVADFFDPRYDKYDLARYFLNKPYARSNKWVDRRDWDRCGLPDEVAPGELIAVGFDGSRYDDSTALRGCRLSDGYLFTIGLWEKPDGPEAEGWEVPGADVDGAVTLAFRRWKVRKMFADPWKWESEIDEWAGRYGDVVQKYDTRHITKMCKALDRLREDILKGEVLHDADQRIARHYANAVRAKRGELYVITKDRPHSPDKIDGAVADTLAYAARFQALAEGALKTTSNRTVVRR